MILVTGGAGFIGSNLVRALNDSGESQILIVDNLASGPKETNLAGLKFTDYLDKHEFRRRLAAGLFDRQGFRAIYHQGACTSTLETDAGYLMDNNCTYAKELLHFSLRHGTPFIYASSAAVYGASSLFGECSGSERPLNLYGTSKLMLDNYVQSIIASAQSTLVGLRYFNVYGRGEAHKGPMSSVVHQFGHQALDSGVVRVFHGSGSYGSGEQRRDFVYVEDVVRVNLFFGQGPVRQGIFNVGTGRSHSFNEVAHAVIAAVRRGRVEYIDFPAALAGKYQDFTEADLCRLRAAGYLTPTAQLVDGVARTVSRLKAENDQAQARVGNHAASAVS